MTLDISRRWLRAWAGVAGAAVIVPLALAFVLTRPLAPPKVTGYVQITNDGLRKFGPLVTDGPRVYLTESRSEGEFTLVQVSAAGGETALVPAPVPAPQLADISPDRFALLVVGTVGSEPEAPLWALPVPAGPAHRLGDILAHDATWLPSGESIVYANGRDLYLAKSDGTESRKLVTVDGFPSGPRWSPDGRVLRFTLQDPKTGSSSLWEVLADGGRLHPLLPGWNNPPAECCGNWTPDGNYFVFESTRNGKTNVWAILEKRGFLGKASREPVQLSAGQIDSLLPVPSKDGKKIFVVGGLPRGELVRYDSKSQQFVPYLSGLSADGVDFSRDGQWVAYVAYPQGTLWRSRTDGSQRLQLSFPPMQVFLPRWSPDTRRIAFAAQIPGKPWKIYLVSAEGGAPQQLVPSEQNEGDPCWSPDGNSLFFDGAPWAEGWAPSSTAIHVLDLRTHQISTVPGSQGLFVPRVSPDGHRLVALPADSRKLVLFDFTARKWADLAKLTAAYPSWSRDGKHVYVDHFSTNDSSILRVRIADRKLEQVVNLKDFRRAWTFGPWTALAPEDSPLLGRDIGSQEIYALDVDLP